MVLCYNTKTVNNIPEETRQKIIDAKVPIELYEKGYFTLGGINKSSITRCANISTNITKNNLPLFPSLFSEMVVDRCLNTTSKLDFRETIDGVPGAGKSISALYAAGRYAIEAAERDGQNPKDYFGLGNCALLQDTDGVTHLMSELDKYQAVVIDDAGVSAGNRDFLTKSNKNLDAIMAVCRPKRWYVIFTSPMNKQLDLQLRELTYCRGKIFKSCHEAGFNIVQQQRVLYKKIKRSYDEINPHYELNGHRVELYTYFTPELLDPFKGIVDAYEEARDKATDSLIHDKAKEERQRKNPVDKREEKSDKIWKEHSKKVYQLTHDANGNWLNRKTVENRKGNTYSVGAIASETGLNTRAIDKIIGRIKMEGKFYEQTP